MSATPHLLPGSIRPIHALRALRAHGPVVALESARTGGDQGLRSLVAGGPRFLAVLQHGRWRTQAGSGDGRTLPARVQAHPFQGLRALLDQYAEPSPEPGAPWGAYGYFGYECNAAPEVARASVPDAWFLFPEVVLEWSPAAGPARLWSRDPAAARDWAERLTHTPCDEVPSRVPGGPVDDLFRPEDLSLDEYRPSFAAIREELRQGNSYQVCFTHALERRFTGDPLDLYQVLCRDNPAPFAAYLEAPGFSLVSSSPERFLRVDGEGRVEARPMKGTAPRGRTPAEDRERRTALESSPKDRAENLMIADLLRNDLARVCELGTVGVTSAAEVEEYATVFQMISRVVGRLEPGRGTADLLAAAFPPGSMTGAPKLRTMEILRRLEHGPRGPYAGILGWWSVDDRADFSVLIRQWLVQAGVARAHVGGGVIWDSRLEEEYQEARTKARALLHALEEVGRNHGSRGATA